MSVHEVWTDVLDDEDQVVLTKHKHYNLYPVPF